jgi:HD-like signal output (HDOD) protein
MRDEKLHLEPEMAARWKTLQQKGVVIPEQPKVLLQIEKLTKSTGFQTRQLATLIRQDPGLSARLLYIVNSPAYGLIEKIGNVENAIIILGADRTLNLCRAVLLREAMNQASPALEIFWKRSAIIAELTVAVAHRQRIGVSNDLAYLIGLFHACGVAVMANALPGYGDALADETTWTHLEEHDRKFAADHVVVSYLVSRYWRLPEQIAESILQQRGYSGCPPECESRDQCATTNANAQCAGLVASLQLALLIYNRILLSSRTSEWEAAREASLATLGMSEEQLARFA